MKLSTTSLTLMALLCLVATEGCKSENSRIIGTPSPTPASERVADSSSPSKSSAPTASPTPTAPKSGNLVEATMSWDVAYEISGIGNASNMKLTLENRTERVWELKVEPGTKFEPSEDNVQRMVVTDEYHVHLEPHERQTVEVKVSCLDINRLAPAIQNRSWSITASQNLARFIRCAKSAVNDIEARGQIPPEARRNLFQFVIWKARGATRDDFVHLVQTYGQEDIPEQEAEEIIDEIEPLVADVSCGSLSDINS